VLLLQCAAAGNYAELKKAGKKDRSKTQMEIWAAVKNYRTWVMVSGAAGVVLGSLSRLGVRRIFSGSYQSAPGPSGSGALYSD
jgi:hypothetical protein